MKIRHKATGEEKEVSLKGWHLEGKEHWQIIDPGDLVYIQRLKMDYWYNEQILDRDQAEKLVNNRCRIR